MEPSNHPVTLNNRFTLYLPANTQKCNLPSINTVPNEALAAETKHAINRHLHRFEQNLLIPTAAAGRKEVNFYFHTSGLKNVL